MKNESKSPKTIEMEKMLWEFISGSSQPVKAEILAQRLSTSIRMVRRLIRDLIAQGHLIASSMEAPYGYFVPKDEEEKRHYRNQLLSRIKHILGRLKDFDKATAEKIEQILLIDDDSTSAVTPMKK